MKATIVCVILTFVLAGCAQLPSGSSSFPAAPTRSAANGAEPRAASGEPDSPPEHDVIALLAYRSRVCAGGGDARRRWLAAHRHATARRERLQLLMTASCNPRQYAALIDHLADSLRSDYAGDAAYRALFGLIGELGAALNAEQVRLEKTIRGLTDIEKDIGSTDDDTPRDKGAAK